ncbi:hypothetical protein [Streptodolium elevatio]
MTIYWKKARQVALPMRRSRYFSRMFLRADDLSLTQDYLLSRQHLLLRQLIPAGVVSGLGLTASGGDVMVAAGVATDEDGTPIVLTEDTRVTLPTGDGTYLATVHCAEHAAESRDEGGVQGETRIVEEARLELLATPPSDPRYVVLGTVKRQGGVVQVDLSTRQLSGIRVQAGPITPTVGKSGTAGIQFPRDPGGGAFDEAFIRYYVHGGEGTTLLIGTANDADDTIDFQQGGAERLRIADGMLLLGGISGTQYQRDQVVAGLGFLGWGVQHGQLSFRAGRGFELVDRSGNFPNLDYGRGSQAYADLSLRTLNAAEDVTVGPGKAVRGQGLLHVDGPDRLYLMNRKGVYVSTGPHAADPEAGSLNVDRNIVLGDILAGRGRLHVDGPERLYLMNRGGVRVESSWHPNDPNAGTLYVHRNLGVQREAGQIPGWSGGGIISHDVFAGGGLYVGNADANVWPIQMYGNGAFYARTKHFAIDHPLDAKRTLVHSALEGPENAVFYRGEATLAKGRAVVELPRYFEALVQRRGRTVQLTPKFVDDEEVFPLAASAVEDGRFTVRALSGPDASHGFYWEVKAVRADVEPLAPDIDRDVLFNTAQRR